MNNTLVIVAMIFWFSTHKVTFNFVFRSSIAIDFEHNLRVTLDSHVSNGLVFNIFSPPLIDLFYKYDDLVLKIYNIVLHFIVASEDESNQIESVNEHRNSDIFDLYNNKI